MAEAPGYLIGPKLLQQIQQTVRHYVNTYGGGDSGRVRQQGQQRVSGKLDGDLAAASDFGTSPASATLSIWRRDSSGNLIDSGENITIYNRMMRISFPAGTPTQAEWIDGEWRIYLADCS